MGNIYTTRINRVIDYINLNIDGDLNLERMSEIASFSKYHFHRIFAEIVGETLGDFIKRIRLEKSINNLRMKSSASITEIAYSCGFSSSAHFSRAFRDAYGLTPSEFRNSKNFQINSNKCQTNSNIVKDYSSEICYNKTTSLKDEKQILERRRIIAMKVEVKEMPEFKAVYVRHIGDYEPEGISKVWDKLCKWAGPRGIIGRDTKFIGIGYDNPEVTPPGKCRYDACITIDRDIEISGEIGTSVIPGGRHAVYHYEGDSAGIKEAYHNLYGVWLPSSGYQPEDRCGYEMYLNDVEKEKKFVMDICIPVKPL